MDKKQTFIYGSTLTTAAILSVVIVPTSIGLALVAAGATLTVGIGASMLANELGDELKKIKGNTVTMNQSGDEKPKIQQTIGNVKGKVEQIGGNKIVSSNTNIGISLTIISILVIMGFLMWKPSLLSNLFNQKLPSIGGQQSPK